MEFQFSCSEILKPNQNGVAVINGLSRLDSAGTKGFAGTWSSQHHRGKQQISPEQKMINAVVDAIGVASAIAQKLNTPVTSSAKLFTGEDRLYLLIDEFKVLGMIKVGTKKLFIRDQFGGIKEIEPLSVLDFYIHESCQRVGYGKILFETMCDQEIIEPHKLAYDRPSSKFLNFLKKHYGLQTYIPQINNFVVFNSYFADDKTFKMHYMDPVIPKRKTESTPKIFNSINNQDNKTESKFDETNFKCEKQQDSLCYQTSDTDYLDDQSYKLSRPLYDICTNSKQEIQSSDLIGIKESDIFSRKEATNSYDVNKYNKQENRVQTTQNTKRNSYERNLSCLIATKANHKDSVKDLFSNNNSKLDFYDQYPKQKSSYAECSIEKTNQQINETENELMQCEQRLRNLNLKSNELKTSAAKLYDRSNFSEESKFRGNNLNRQDDDYDAYDKQFDYSTVYNNKYKNSSCISKNQIKNINSASNHIPSKASYSISSGDLLNKATSSSAYGSFFNKYRF